MTEILYTEGVKIADTKTPAGPLEGKWEKRKFEARLVNPANRRKMKIIIVGTGLSGSGAAATLGQLGYDVDCFCFHDSPRRAHSVAAQGGINAARARKIDGDSLKRFVKDTVKGGDYRGREADAVRLGIESVKVIDHMYAIGAPFAREYGGQLATRSFGGVQVSRTYYTRGETGQQLEVACSQALQEQVDAGTVKMHNRMEMLDLVVADGRAQGIVTRDLLTGEVRGWTAHVVVLCTGGYGSVDAGQGLERPRHVARAPSRRLLRQPLLPPVPPDRPAGQPALAVQDHAHERVAAQRRPHLGAEEARRRPSRQ